MNDAARYGLSLGCGILAALGLFVLMNVLVSRGEAGVEDRQRVPMPRFIRMDDQEQVVRRREREQPTPPEKIQPLPRMEALAAPQKRSLEAPALDLPLPDISADLALAGLPLSAPPAEPEGPVRYTQSLTPVSQIPPRYPRRAQLDGISGWVRLEFIVNPDGTVSDVTVVEAEPRRGIFDQEAVRALSRWRFQPQIRDGEPVQALATIVIKFSLEG
ncbi:energy transducer TonB [Desulfonatronum sp. SC1]|uniref:energy transducer TonB n=1 Tax=Desulfonatronum sp. SC1 TaxID=2109626 RepID=UPI000D2FFAFA|nr:energy transducer TonB [Desulfonatronum sp. SC1]PTN38778.1 energy transducer TonB [Desulfonatronum sp. SC1]